jgi:hypothetical protein
MKTYSVNITEAAYKRIRSEVTVATLANPEGATLLQEFLTKLFKSWDKGEASEIKLRSEALDNQ